MTDFTVKNQLPPTHINTWTRWLSGNTLRTTASQGTPAAITWATANTAVFIPMAIPWAFNAQRAFWMNGSTLGNADIGIYTPGGAKLWSAGSTAQSGSSVLQFVTITGGMILNPGAYYLGFVVSGTTTAVGGFLPTAASASATGLLQQASALPLPASATFAAPTTPVGFPLAGLTSTPSGF